MVLKRVVGWKRAPGSSKPFMVKTPRDQLEFKRGASMSKSEISVLYNKRTMSNNARRDKDRTKAALRLMTQAMREKLAASRRSGRYGWWDDTVCSGAKLSDMLRECVRKGDPVDVANFCTMLYARGERISPENSAGRIGSTTDSPIDVIADGRETAPRSMFGLPDAVARNNDRRQTYSSEFGAYAKSKLWSDAASVMSVSHVAPSVASSVTPVGIPAGHWLAPEQPTQAMREAYDNEMLRRGTRVDLAHHPMTVDQVWQLLRNVAR